MIAYNKMKEELDNNKTNINFIENIDDYKE